MSNSTYSTTTEIIKENNNNKQRSYLTRNYFDYAKGDECKYIYCEKSGHHNLKTKGPVPGGYIILKDRLRLVFQIKKQMSHEVKYGQFFTQF